MEVATNIPFIAASFQNSHSGVVNTDPRRLPNCCLEAGTEKASLFTCVHFLSYNHVLNGGFMGRLCGKGAITTRIDTSLELKRVINSIAVARLENTSEPMDKVSCSDKPKDTTGLSLIRSHAAADTVLLGIPKLLHPLPSIVSQENQAVNTSSIPLQDQKAAGLNRKIDSLKHGLYQPSERVSYLESLGNNAETCNFEQHGFAHMGSGHMPQQAVETSLNAGKGQLCANLLQQQKKEITCSDMASFVSHSQDCMLGWDGGIHCDCISSADAVHFNGNLGTRYPIQNLDGNAVHAEEIQQEGLAEEKKNSKVSECRKDSVECKDAATQVARLSKGRGKCRRYSDQKAEFNRQQAKKLLKTGPLKGHKARVDASPQFPVGQALTGNELPANLKQQTCEQKVPTFKGFAVEGVEGSGGYGTVYRAVRKSDGKFFAIKYPFEKTSPKYVSNEIMMLQRYGGKHFIPLCEGVIEASGRDCLVLEYIEHEKPEVLKKEITISELQLYGYSLFRALSYLHEKGVAHRDVKPGNFLFSRQRQKGSLIDFNLAVIQSKQAPTRNKKNLLDYENADPAISVKIDNDAVSSKRQKLLTGYPMPGELMMAKQDRKGATNLTEKSYTLESTVSTSSHVVDAMWVIHSRCRNMHQVAPTRHQQMVSKNGFCRDPALQDRAKFFGITGSPVNGKSAQSTDTGSPALKGPRVHSLMYMSPSREQDGTLQSGHTHSGADLSKEPLPRTGRRELLDYVEKTMKSPQPQVASQHVSQRKRVAAPQKKKNQINVLDRGLSAISNLPKKSHFVMPEIPQHPLRTKGIRKNRKEGSCAGTKGYRAPEVLLRTLLQSVKIDVWSAGVTLLQLVAGRSPFPSSSADQSLTDIARLCGAEAIKDLAKAHSREDSLSKDFSSQKLQPISVKEWCKSHTKRLELLDLLPPSLFDLLDRCLQVNPDNRISAAEAVRHEFFSPCRQITSKDTTKS